MFRIACQKMWHKKWMNLSLLVGCILLISVCISFPMYRTASYDRMLRDEFTGALTKEGGWPCTIHSEIYAQRDKNGTIKKMQNLLEKMDTELMVTSKEKIMYYSISRMELGSDIDREDAEGTSLRLGGITDMFNHIDLVAGELPSESGYASDGALEVLVSRNGLISQGLLLGERMTFKNLNDSKGKPISIVVKGVFDKKEEEDPYWDVINDNLANILLIDMDLFKSKFSDEHSSKYSIDCNYYLLFEYDDLSYDMVDHLIEKTEYYTQKSGFKSVIDFPSYMNILNSYSRKINRISATLLILQIPLLLMLCAFLFMISGQMYEMEKNEISVIKSRGSSRFQIFLIYVYQSLVLTITGLVAGIFLGMQFARVLGSTRNFLEFENINSLSIHIDNDVWMYAIFACALTFMSMSIPAIKHSKVSIVNLKQSRATSKKALWQKLYLDIVLIAVSLYGYYSFNKNSISLSESVLEGKSLDPLLYISSSLFILGLGLLFLRLQPIIIFVIYKIGEKFWGCASYVSFRENIRNSRKMQLIMLFMIITVSLGIFHATVARTILQNALDNEEYLTAGEVIIKENWPMGMDPTGVSTGYIEPDFTKYQHMDWADKVTRVYYFDNAFISNKGNDRDVFTLMGIHTKEFGEMTKLSEGLNKESYREYLNLLAVEPNGVLASSNLMKNRGYKVGDIIYYKISSTQEASGKIIGFFDYWPGYAKSVFDLNPDGTAFEKENYMLVTHFSLLKNSFGTVPYEIWVDAKDDCEEADILEWIKAKKVPLVKYSNMKNQIEDTLMDPLLQGTNGILTLGFVVTLGLCAIGYLIYWVMAIKERELMFGVLRASGFHKLELIHLLLNEQIFTGILSVLSGIGIGKLTAKMFVPILQQAYASENQVLPMNLVTQSEDMIKIYIVISFAMLFSLGLLTVIILKMNVAKALKLGEE